MRIYPAVHYTMGGLWVDYDLQTTIPGLFAIGEANFSDHGANRLGASALMQGLSDGYFVLPPVLNDYIADGELDERRPGATPPSREVEPTACSERHREAAVDQRHTARSTRSTASSARCSGTTAAWPATRAACARRSSGSPSCATSSGATVKVPGTGEELNQQLEKANRVADFLEFGELMVLDALVREESCGGHFREEHQTADGEAERDDEQLQLRRRLGVRRAPDRARSCTRKTSSSSTSTSPSGAMPDEDHRPGLAAGRPGRRRARWSTTPSTTSPRTCRSWRCSTSSTSS